MTLNISLNLLICDPDNYLENLLYHLGLSIPNFFSGASDFVIWSYLRASIRSKASNTVSDHSKLHTL